MLIDSHAHLQWRSFDQDREEVINLAKEANVKYIVNIGYDLEGSKKAVELAERHEGLYATVGIHPHNASALNEKVLDNLRRLSENPMVVAIGEIGLDYYRNLSPKTVQQKAFEAQMILAQELELPVVIHDRDAHADVANTLSKFKGKLKGVMHCFSGNLEMAEQCAKMNYYISFAGPVTFPNAHMLHETAKSIDLNSILLETDCPWLAPQEMRGKRNEPAFLPFTAEKIANLRGISLEELAEATTRNTKRIFHIS
ncbi:MAG TPA: TatD family hydrolase [Patescibacteria group bacterium]|nr:TatD family hydrolase [Patescibacteria group bacterium]